MPRQRARQRRASTRPTTRRSCSPTTSRPCGPTRPTRAIDDGPVPRRGHAGHVPRRLLLAAPRPDARRDGAEPRSAGSSTSGRSRRRSSAGATAGSRCSRTAARRWAPRNPHPHGQIWAGRRACPARPPREHAHAGALPRGDRAARCCSTTPRAGARRAAGGRRRAPSWLVVVPFWAAWPFETLLDPAAARAARLAGPRRRRARRARGRAPRPDPSLRRAVRPAVPVLDGLAPGAVRRRTRDRRTGRSTRTSTRRCCARRVRKFMVGYELLAEPQRDLTPEEAAERLRAAVPATGG